MNDEPGIEDEIDPKYYRTAFLSRIDLAIRFAADSDRFFAKASGGRKRRTMEMIAAARAVAAAWSKLAQTLEHRRVKDQMGES